MNAEPWATHHEYVDVFLVWMVTKAELGLVFSLPPRLDDDGGRGLLSLFRIWVRDAQGFYLTDQNELILLMSQSRDGEDQSIVREAVFDDLVLGRYTMDERVLCSTAEGRSFNIECCTPGTEDILPRPVRIKLPGTSLGVMRILEHEIQGCEERRSLDDYDILVVLNSY